VNARTQHTHPHSSDEDSGEFFATLDLHPQPEEILAVKNDHPQPKIHTTMSVKGGRNTSFQIDTGATCNVIRSKELRGTKYEKKVLATDQVLRMYNSSPLIPAGICHVQLTNPTNGKKYNVKFVVVDDKDANINLLGSRAAQQMNLIQVNHENISDQANEVHAVDNQCTGELTKEDILQKYPDVFEGIGELGESLHLEVDDTVKPVQIPPRRIPEALRKPLKDHLDELEEQVRRTHRMGELSRSQQEEQWENPPLSRPTAFK
jgi:hypothetical protein